MRMLKPIATVTLVAISVSACDAGPYDRTARHDDGASTGSLLSGTDTGVNANGAISNTGIGSNKGFGSPGSGR